MTAFLIRFVLAFASFLSIAPWWVWITPPAGFLVAAALTRRTLIAGAFALAMLLALFLVAADLALFWAALNPVDYGYGR